MKQTRPVWCIAGAAVAIVLGASSYAFACSASAYLGPLSPNAGPRGTEVTVTGSSWAASSSRSTDSNASVGPVEIRWGSESGPILGTANGPEFSVNVVIPDAAPAYYVITGVARRGDGTVVGRQSRTFRLTASAPAATSTPTGSSTTPTGGSAVPSGGSNDPAASGSTASPADPIDQATSPAAAESAAVAPASADAAAQRSPASVTSAATSDSGRTLAPSAPSPTPTAARRIPGAAAIGTNGLATAGAAPAASAIPYAAPLPAPAGATPAPSIPLVDPSAVWDGLGTDVPAGARPSLVSEVPPGGTRTSPAFGIALLGIGMVSLSVVALVAAVSRRRASAHSGRR